MKKTVLGILAHVDSGKTTLSESLLYKFNMIRTPGRVDHKNAFLDTDEIERERGITIFSKQAVIKNEKIEITLLDTPGHTDFCAETERVLGVLDYAVLVVSGSEGVQSHTKTLWNLLKNHSIPTFIFVNKMDISAISKEALINEIKTEFSENCVDFNDGSFLENVAVCDEKLTELFLEGKLCEKDIADSVFTRRVFPVVFGSALKHEGIDRLVELLENYTISPSASEEFGGKVFKISEDEKGVRMTHLKITGGSLKVKELLNGVDEEGTPWSEKVNEIRIYSGEKFSSVQEAQSGTVCAVVGLSKTYHGEGLGFEKDFLNLTSEPIFTYKVNINDGTDIKTVLLCLNKLKEEETKLNVIWNEQLKEIHISLMGEVQLEIITRIVKERFNIDVSFEESGILYKETIKEAIEGVGHYEPLRHYAEVHLLLEPSERGKGLIFDTKVSEDELDKNWQRLVLTHLKEKKHIGVLTGSPITDMKITLVSGKAHIKHTEGGDFRQATYRALRQGLMYAENVLLEPYFDFELKVPGECIGRAMTDIERMGGKVNPPELSEDFSVLTGSAPVRKIRNYKQEIIVYTKGRGTISCTFKDYEECLESDEIISSANYNPEGDLLNSPDSVFCSHGSGFPVKWNEVYDYMHIPLLKDKKEEELQPVTVKKLSSVVASEEELIEIFERTYGKIQRKLYKPLNTEKYVKKEKPFVLKNQKSGPDYLLIDGYNIIFASEELTALAKTSSLEHARLTLINRICNYRIVRDKEIILVFDAYKVKNNPGEQEKVNNITIVYTKEAETADAYIEKVTHDLSKNHKVFVATSDGLEQMIILGTGALRIPASSFLKDLDNAEKEIEDFIEGM